MKLKDLINKITPLPWHSPSHLIPDDIPDAERKRANSDYIAHAVNNLPVLLATCEEMRSLLGTIPVNYTNPKLCIGDLDRWDKAIAEAKEVNL